MWLRMSVVVCLCFLGFLTVGWAQDLVKDLAGHPCELLGTVPVNDPLPTVIPASYFVPVPELGVELKNRKLELLVQYEEETAEAELNAIKKKFSQLIQEYPETKAAQEAQKILEKSGLKVYSSGRIAPVGGSLQWADSKRVVSSS